MLHEPITADADPDLLQAVEDLLETGAELRQVNEYLKRCAKGGRDYIALRHQQAQLTDIIALRAEGRLQMSAEALTICINDELNRRARRGRGQPSRPSARTLLDAVTAAQAKELDARRALKAASAEFTAARAARRAAEEAYQVYGTQGLRS